MKPLIHLLIMGFLLQPFTGCTQTKHSNLVTEAENMLHSGTSVSAIFSNPRFDSVRPLTAFRAVIKDHAMPGMVTMVTEKEPGIKITVKGVVTDAAGKPAVNRLVYVYQTDHRGWYGADRDHFSQSQGDYGHARLFAYSLTNAQGHFEFNTIQPHGYPQSDLPAHIHIEIFHEGKSVFISELLFDDDERLVGDRRTKAVAAGFIVSKPTTENGKKLYRYSISLSR